MSTEIIEQILELKEEIKKHENDEDKVIQILKQISKIKVTDKEIKKTKLGKLLGKFRSTKNKELKEVLENLIKQWKDILNKSETKPKPKEKEKEKEKPIIEEYLLQEENVSKRNNARKNIYKYLEPNLKDNNEETKRELAEKVVEIEEKIFAKFKGDSPYVNRILEIIHNIKDENNLEFRENIINGIITSDDLCTMNANEMLNKAKKDEIKKEIEKKVDEVRSDWIEKHGEVTEGVYKCRNCGGKRTIQHEQQTRSADEPMTLFITCVDCKNTWKG